MAGVSQQAAFLLARARARFQRLVRNLSLDDPAKLLAEPNNEGENQLVAVAHMQNFDTTTLVLSWVGMLCWAVCFWWMHRISSRQDALLKELRSMTKRIEKLSQSEHELISEVHPRVNEIKEHVENVREAVSR